MKLNISSASEEPIYEQIKSQIRSAIVSGELQAGDALPSLRKLAGDLHISVLTASKAYNELADEGLVKNIQGKGAFVMDHGNELIRERAEERIMDRFREASIEAKASGISLLDLLGMFEKAYREQS